MNNIQPVRRALLSVADKTGIISFAAKLERCGIEILSTGGTYKALTESGISALEIADYTSYPELMAGRVKTLHPKVHGGILGRRGQDDDVMAKHGILPIDMVVVNLYPFAATIQQAGCTLSKAIDYIDIGGPAMIRAAAKNYCNVAVIVNYKDYDKIVAELLEHQCQLTQQTCFQLAVTAFEHIAEYDLIIANYLSCFAAKQQQDPAKITEFPSTLTQQFIKKQELRYGENPHQKAAFYIDKQSKIDAIVNARQLHGKKLSFNNIADADTAWECVSSFTDPACVIVKHANPCGVALGSDILAAYEKAYQTDPVSAFGGIIAVNKELDKQAAQVIIDRQFVEVIIAPKVSAQARAIIFNKPNVRLLIVDRVSSVSRGFDFKRVNGGLLVQHYDDKQVLLNELTIVSKRHPNKTQLADLLFTWQVAKYVKSNAIVYGKQQQTLGIGAGQMSRIYSAKIASIKAEDGSLSLINSVMASDAFFPFRDGIDIAAQAGVSCIIQPGGSVRDDEVIAAANEYNLVMAFTGIRHFRH